MGGATKAACGIRETGDIDLVVTGALFDGLEGAGWERKARPNGKPGLRWGEVEAFLDVDCGASEVGFDRLRSDAESIDGIPFVVPGSLRRLKLQYGRPKDLRDARLLEDYLSSRER